MKNLVISIIILVFISLLFELFCSGTRMFKFSKLCFALVFVFIVIGYVANFVSNSDKNFLNLDLNSDSEVIGSVSVNNLQKIIESEIALICNSETAIKIQYDTKNGSTIYNSVQVKVINGKVSEEEIKSIISKYLSCEVYVT